MKSNPCFQIKMNETPVLFDANKDPEKGVMNAEIYINDKLMMCDIPMEDWDKLTWAGIWEMYENDFWEVEE